MQHVQQLLTTVDVELRVNVLRVRAHGVLADDQALGDGGHAVPARDKLHDLRFARRQPVRLLQHETLLRRAIADDARVFGCRRAIPSALCRRFRRLLLPRLLRRADRQELDGIGRHRALRRQRFEQRARGRQQREAQHVARYHGHDEQPLATADPHEVAHPAQQEAGALHDVGHAAEEPVDEHRVDAAVARDLRALHHHEHLH